jgi:transcriptional regulator with XRE-family HTH domain
MNSNTIILNNLRSHRIQAGLRQLDVAWALGLESPDRISRWENGTAVPHLVNLFKLAALYKTQPEKLYADLFANLEQNLYLRDLEERVGYDRQ